MSNQTTTPLLDITISTLVAYNAGGPPERANLTHDGKPVPALDAMGASVQHKWACATSAAASAGADAMYTAIVELIGPHAAELGGLEIVRRRVLGMLAPSPWTPPTA